MMLTLVGFDASDLPSLTLHDVPLVLSVRWTREVTIVCIVWMTGSVSTFAVDVWLTDLEVC